MKTQVEKAKYKKYLNKLICRQSVKRKVSFGIRIMIIIFLKLLS